MLAKGVLLFFVCQARQPRQDFTSLTKNRWQTNGEQDESLRLSLSDDDDDDDDFYYYYHYYHIIILFLLLLLLSFISFLG